MNWWIHGQNLKIAVCILPDMLTITLAEYLHYQFVFAAVCVFCCQQCLWAVCKESSDYYDKYEADFAVKVTAHSKNSFNCFYDDDLVFLDRRYSTSDLVHAFSWPSFTWVFAVIAIIMICIKCNHRRKSRYQACTSSMALVTAQRPAMIEENSIF